jgi:hypothetical protein
MDPGIEDESNVVLKGDLPLLKRLGDWICLLWHRDWSELGLSPFIDCGNTTPSTVYIGESFGQRIVEERLDF